jgi:hypothetical protein
MVKPIKEKTKAKKVVTVKKAPAKKRAVVKKPHRRVITYNQLGKSGLVCARYLDHFKKHFGDRLIVTKARAKKIDPMLFPWTVTATRLLSTAGFRKFEEFKETDSIQLLLSTAIWDRSTKARVQAEYSYYSALRDALVEIFLNDTGSSKLFEKKIGER